MGKDEYTETIYGAYELLLRTLRHLGVSIIKVGRRNFRNEHGCCGRTSVMFTQTRGGEN